MRVFHSKLHHGKAMRMFRVLYGMKFQIIWRPMIFIVLKLPMILQFKMAEKIGLKEQLDLK